MRYIIAADGKTAAGHMLHDRKWRRVGRDLFLDEDGEQVCIVYDRNTLVGTDPDRIYLGWGASSRRDYPDLMQLVSWRNPTVIDLTTLPKAR